MGKPGFPTPAPQGNGETRFPHSPTRGRVWAGYALPGTTFPTLPGIVAYTANQSMAGAAIAVATPLPRHGGNQVSP